MNHLNSQGASMKDYKDIDDRLLEPEPDIIDYVAMVAIVALVFWIFLLFLFTF